MYLNVNYNEMYLIFLAVNKSPKDDKNDKQEGLKSVLVVYVRSKSSKKSVSWKQETDLVQVSYFEHDETERGMLLLVSYISCTHKKNVI